MLPPRDVVAPREEPVVGVAQHLLVGPAGTPPQLVAGRAHVEPHRLSVHDPVVGREGAQVEGRAEPHGGDRRTGRDAAHPRPGAGVPAQRFEPLPHRAEPLGSDVVDGWTRALGRPPARVGEVGGVDELVDVVAGAEHRHGRAVGDPVEQDPEDPEPPVTQDRARPHHRDVQSSGDRRSAEKLGVELRATVGLLGLGLGGPGHRVGVRDAEHRRRGRVDDLADPCFLARTRAGPRSPRR